MSQGWCDGWVKSMRTNVIHCCDSLGGMRKLAAESIDLVFTSPPYVDLRRGGVRPDNYVAWFLPFAFEIKRLLKASGSFILNINDRVVKKERHLYVHELVLALKRYAGLKYIEPYVWHKPNAFPGAYGRRLKDAFEYVFWFGKTVEVAFYPEAVGMDYVSLGSGESATLQRRVSGRTVRPARMRRRGWSDPGNVVTEPVPNMRNPHPAQMPMKLAQVFVKLATQPGDLVLDPFAGSGTTLVAAKQLGRRYLGYEIVPEYAELARSRLKRVRRGAGAASSAFSES